jgi:hypothetical protein
MLSCTKLSLIALKFFSVVVVATSIAPARPDQVGNILWIFLCGILWKEPCSDTKLSHPAPLPVWLPTWGTIEIAWIQLEQREKSRERE